MKGSSSSTSGWDVCIGADRTGSTGVKGNDAVIAAAVCTGDNADMTETDVDTSWASESSVSPDDKEGNTCTGDTVNSSCAVGAAGVLESSGTGRTVADVCTGRGCSGIIWFVVAEESCSSGSSVAAAGWDEGDSSSSAERVWLDDGGKDLLCSLSK